jgi:hypothetical protein
VTKTAPGPSLRSCHQGSRHRILVHVSQLFLSLVRAPNVEVVVARLPEWARIGFPV